jgi:hypothetical protein
MSNRGINAASVNTVVNPANRQLLVRSDAPIGVGLDLVKENIATLNKFETKCLLIQLGSLESNTNSNLISLGNPVQGIFRANINANTVISYQNTYFANIATIAITNADHSAIKLGTVANIVNTSTGAFGSNTMVIKKSVGGNIIAGNFVPGFTYTVTSIGTTDFTLCGVLGGIANVIVGNTFVANTPGSGTGTAFLANNQIMLGSDHTISGDINFTVSPLKLGKYQNSQWLLNKFGYVNADGTWNSKDGVDGNDIFLSAIGVQDSIMRDFIQAQYADLIKAGAIRPGDSKEIVSGMLAVAYQYQDLGNPELKQNVYNTDGTINLENYSIASKANVWRTDGQTLDSQGRPGHIYFNGGRYAVGNLGADVTE